jgi:hypothetical protein
MATRLTPCPSCTRHLRVGTSQCPFCQSSVLADLPERPVLQLLGPMTRAIILIGGVVASTGCSPLVGSVEYGNPCPCIEFPGNVDIGQPCTGDVYVAAIEGTGYLVCQDGVWIFSDEHPGAGFTPYVFDAGSPDAAGAADATTSDAGRGDAHDAAAVAPDAE